MRRILTAALASSLLALALPAAASAHHHARAHKRHHKHAHMVVFAPSAKRSGTTTTTTTTEPPTTPSEPVVTVASFEGGVLKLTLADGSTVSGKVTEATEIECGCDHAFSGGSPEWQHDGASQEGQQDGWQNGGPGSFHQDDEQGPPQETHGEEGCGTSALVPGAKVKEAELNVTGAGAVWEKVELLPKS